MINSEPLLTITLPASKFIVIEDNLECGYCIACGALLKARMAWHSVQHKANCPVGTALQKSAEASALTMNEAGDSYGGTE